MAYQLELPLPILKEERITSEGMFDPGIHQWKIIRIDVADPEELKRDLIRGYVDSWIEAVRECYYRRRGR